MRVTSTSLVAILIWCLPVPAVLGQEPSPPTPTPHCRTLADYAAGRTLDTAARSADGRIELTTENLGELGAGGALTRPVGTVRTAQAVPSPAPADPRVKRRWQAAVERRRRAVDRLEARRAALERDLDAIRDARPTARTLAREDGIREKIRQLDEELATAWAALARVQRQARRDGAEPGWFR